MDEPTVEESSTPPPLEEEAVEEQPTSQESSDESQNVDQIQEKPAPTPNTQPSTEQQPAITEEVEAEKPAQPKKDFSKTVADVKETVDLSQTVASSPNWDLADFQHTIRFLQPSGNTWVPVPTPY